MSQEFELFPQSLEIGKIVGHTPFPLANRAYFLKNIEYMEMVSL